MMSPQIDQLRPRRDALVDKIDALVTAFEQAKPEYIWHDLKELYEQKTRLEDDLGALFAEFEAELKDQLFVAGVEIIRVKKTDGEMGLVNVRCEVKVR
jgi:hypothetical protein